MRNNEKKNVFLINSKKKRIIKNALFSFMRALHYRLLFVRFLTYSGTFHWKSTLYLHFRSSVPEMSM